MQPELVSIQDLYPDKFDVDDDEYDAEDDFALNLGAESVAPTPPPEPSNFPNAFLPATSMKRQRSHLQIRSSHTDCAICLQPAIRPFLTSCCEKVLCDEHLQYQLHTSHACLSCGSPYLVTSPTTISSLHVVSQKDSDSCDDSSNSHMSFDCDASASIGSESDSAEETPSSSHTRYTLLPNPVSTTVDPELAGLAGGVLGKVLSIVALTLVFYVLFN
ncbi:hypothetical protein F5879DRAFT_979572 [Lentinula edodes]|uniref:RING-type domain-containing protein n=1 Tax=Lentinula edodes TaxID=5353 RepID=A0A1Q3ER93_LENED|nr:hypothetical protein F5879DRAFT_979572 [Lentinula edodes]GAW09727.1 hypothetical protein LENED_011909 [Lentinula edodes]